MAIAAQRFSLMSQETNVAVASFTKGMDSAVFNDPAQVLKEAQDGLSNIVGNLAQSSKAFLDNIDKDPLKAVSRAAKDIKGQINDLKALPNKALDEVLGSLGLNNPAIMKGLKDILGRCSNNGLGKGLPGKPYDTSMNCGGGNISMGKGGGSGCNAAGYNDILNKLSGGSYNAAFNDYNGSLKALMALSGYGYNLGMCGVFGALTKGLPGDVLGKAAGSLLSSLGVGGNVMGFMDVAKSAVGLATKGLSPSSVVDFLGNFSAPDWLKEADFSDMADRVMGAAELVDEEWSTSEFDDAVSLSSCDGYQEDLGDIFGANVSDRSFDMESLDEAPSDDATFFQGAYLTQDAADPTYMPPAPMSAPPSPPQMSKEPSGMSWAWTSADGQFSAPGVSPEAFPEDYYNDFGHYPDGTTSTKEYLLKQATSSATMSTKNGISAVPSQTLAQAVAQKVSTTTAKAAKATLSWTSADGQYSAPDLMRTY